MIQTYSMVLWSRPKQEDFEVSVDKTYKLLSALKEYGAQLSPNYLPARRKKDVKEYFLNYESLKELLKKGVPREGDKIFQDLGCTIGFFSSLNDDDSAGISISIGISNPKFTNAFVLHLPLSLNVFDSAISEKLIDLFRKSVMIFNPFWGCILNSCNVRRFESLYKNSQPTTVHWVNFWGYEILNRIPENKIINNTPLYLVERIKGKGYILVLMRKPIDDNSEEDIKVQSEANRRIGLVR